jgi:multidrug transporter EmrE-like cation transporter
MARLLDVFLYATYAVFNTAAMAAIKTALPRLGAGRTARGLIAATCGAVTYVIALGAMLLLLRRHDASIVIPIAIGCVILVTHIAGRRFYGEPLTAPKIVGACLVVAGVALLCTTGSAS